MKSIAANDKRRYEVNRLCSTVSLFLEINITQTEASVTLFALVVLISQFLENYMFSVEMDPRLQFRSSKGLEKSWLLKCHSKMNFDILFCDRVVLITEQCDADFRQQLSINSN